MGIFNTKKMHEFNTLYKFCVENSGNTLEFYKAHTDQLDADLMFFKEELTRILSEIEQSGLSDKLTYFNSLKQHNTAIYNRFSYSNFSSQIKRENLSEGNVNTLINIFCRMLTQVAKELKQTRDEIKKINNGLVENKQSMNKRQLYESIMREVSREVKKTLNMSNISEKVDLSHFSSDTILKRYNIDIFDLNEGFGENLDKYKNGVANAIRKITSKIGDVGGNVVKNVIDIAKRTNPKTLVLVLSMLCVFGGQASAEISYNEAKQFMFNCQKLYNKSESEINQDGRYQVGVSYMINDSTGVYFTGYGSGATWEEAEKIASHEAQKRCMNCNDWSYDQIDIQNMEMKTSFIRQKDENGQKCCIAIRWFKKK